MVKVNEILDFWFQGKTDEDKLDFQEPPAKIWFMKDESTDAEILKTF